MIQFQRYERLMLITYGVSYETRKSPKTVEFKVT